ncbi:replication factor C subunit 1 [Episyrphus balteatus]|uniref:replication factor C subunit 1 n=1 Tax=Episyrphus balteatus TaxID=286459 RepID=UPI002485F130|nr:replication factor C subunit 1 [Episyrphus balteatus]
MQRGIDSYFNKVPSKKTEPPAKRKALVISSDEEQSPKKNSTPNKKAKLSKTSDQIKRKDVPTKSEKQLKSVDVTALFGGEATRETKKPHKSSSSKDEIKNNEAISPLKNTSKEKKTETVSPSASKDSHKNESREGTNKISKKSALSQLVDELETPKKSSVTSKKSPEDKNRSKEHDSVDVKASIKTNTPKKSTDEDEFIPESEKKTVHSKKLDRSIKKEKEDKTAEAKERKKADLESSVLSDEERFERKRMAAVLYQKFKNRSSVINPGSKEIPKGKPNCLAGITFLVTGILESIERNEANSIIKELGGKVSSTVGKRLNYIIAGEEAGPKKLADAEALRIPLLTVDDFFNLIREKSGEKVERVKEEPIKSDKSPKTKKTPLKRKHDEDDTTSMNIKKEVEDFESKSQISIKKEIDIKKEVKNEIKTNIKVEGVEFKPEIKVIPENNIAWVDKYKPTAVKQIIGQQGPASNCSKLLNWLTKWHTNQSGPKKSQKPNPWAKNDDGSYFKAALLSGPPGVGKTTTATLVCQELGYDIVEFNASDTRSKRLLKEEVSELLSNKSLHGYFTGNTQIVSKKHVLIMDEVDGMAGNEDRGGIQELILLIKESHVPIICMCNDRNHQKMRSLVNYCYDLRFNRPRLEQIKGFIRSICFKEKIKISPEKIDEIILATNNDIRQSVNHICLLSSGDQIELSTKGTKTAQKDLKMGPWEVVRKVFSAEDHKTMSLADKADLFFHDYSMAPLFVQQNYLMVSPSGPKSDVLKKVALTADSLSLGDLVDRRIRSNSAWTLLPVQAVLSSVLPGEYMEGHFTGQINFPGWLGKYSRSNKRSRLAQEIHDHTRLRTSGSRLSIRMDYAPFLLSNIVRPLKDRGLEGVEESLKVLQEYRLLREDIDSLIELTNWPGKKSIMDAVDGRVKAALTRSYNKEVLPYSYSAVTTLKKKKGEANEGEDLLGLTETEEGETAVVESEEEDNSLDNDNLIKAKKKPVASTSKASKKATTSTKPKVAGRSKK